MKKQLLFPIILCLVSTLTMSQGNYQRCGTDEYNAWLRSLDPASAQGMDAANAAIEQWLLQNQNNLRMQGTSIVIPVVVHVVYNLNSTSQNISDELIKSQIDVLNEDFGGYNSDIIKTPPFFRGRLANDTGIRFELAKRDPNGNATNGIVRVSTTVTSFSQNNAVKYTAQGGSNAWNSSQYLNMWVCNLGGGLLGYAQFPGGTAATDGVVILYSAFGRVSAAAPYNYGRTVTHEVGHWLGLRHIWGDANCGNDLVNDTPTQSTSNSGCPSCHGFTCNNQPVGDMYMNYMDYTDDKCMYMFTQGQADRMWATLNTTRSSLATSPGLNPVTTPALDAGIAEIISPAFSPCNFTTRSFIPEVVLKNYGSSTLTSVTINYKIDNGTTSTQSWTGSLAPGATTTITLPQQNLSASNVNTDHIFYAWTTSPNGGTDGEAVNDRTSRNFIGHAINAAFPISQGFETTPFPPIGWANKNYDCGSAWQRLNTAAHSGTYSMVFSNYTQAATQIGVMDEMITQPIDMSNAPANAALKFWVAYAQRTASATDTLEIFASTDCGKTYTSIYKKWGSALATAPANNSAAFVPSSAEWREETVSLAPYLGVKNLMIAFRNTHGGGNNLYIDDIGVTPTSVQEFNAGVYMNIFPNPASDKLSISLQFDKYSDARIQMTDVLGKEVYVNNLKGINQVLEIDLAGISKGIYLIKVETAGGVVTKEVAITQ